ncbi:MAG: HEAT repeat domain-containing protein [Candidatus Thiodiazotropha sp.]|jgi:HEAT repeat protein
MPRTAPDALLLLATGCAHCPGVLEGLSQLLKQGRLGRLEVVNILSHPEAAEAVGTRSVPWTRIGLFELEGALSPTELGRWADLADSEAGIAAYYSHLLETRRPHKLSQLLAAHPETLTQLIGLLGDDKTPMAIRIGIGVVLEEMEGSSLLAQGLDALIKLAELDQANIRCDAAHYLGLTHHGDAEAPLRKLLTDEHPDVREIAEEALQMLTPSEEKNG